MMHRARPLLGTLVSILADGDAAALQAAFAAVTLVHRLMSVQSESSDVSRINREARDRPVTVHPWTYAVLRIAREIAEASAGAFDITLARDGASYADVQLLDDGRVRLRRTARIDLSGIAKGFAVDCAVAALWRHGARSGSVNAGGDLRLFGRYRPALDVRVPSRPTRAVRLPPVEQRAFATSGAYFGSRLVDPLSAEAVSPDWSVTVCADRCVWADALTKATLLRGPLAGLLSRFRARAFAMDAHGTLYAAPA